MTYSREVYNDWPQFLKCTPQTATVLHKTFAVEKYKYFTYNYEGDKVGWHSDDISGLYSGGIWFESLPVTGYFD
jgi:hypothetical protein